MGVDGRRSGEELEHFVAEGRRGYVADRGDEVRLARLQVGFVAAEAGEGEELLDGAVGHQVEDGDVGRAPALWRRSR